MGGRSRNRGADWTNQLLHINIVNIKYSINTFVIIINIWLVDLRNT